MKMRCIWYQTAKDIFDAQALDFVKVICQENGLTPDDLGERGWQGSDETETYTDQEALSGIESLGYWGFCNSTDGVIHIWPGTATDEELASLIGHEIGHASGKQCSDVVEEETRADSYGEAVVETMHWLKQRPSDTGKSPDHLSV